MQYDPVKGTLDRLFGLRPVARKAFFALLHLVFLRLWYVRRELRALMGGFPPSRTVEVLDAGTGFAQVAYHIVRTFPNACVLAVDVKPDYLERARRFVERTGLQDRIRFEQQDLTAPDIDRTFDLIVSVDVMEHIEDDRTVFGHFAGLLKDGAHVLINTPSDRGGSDVGVAGEGGFVGEHVRTGYNLDELCGKLEEAGLEPVRAFYTYGRYGTKAWRLLVKWPMQLLGATKLALVVLPVYYLAALPVGLTLNVMDTYGENETGTGLIVVAKKGPSS